ncbi:MAG: ribose 5-phosphate isomerase B [Bryobacterales bacterium]|nr:ribose 5-phosphate isomerase B [Bryobacterales bacterium]
MKVALAADHAGFALKETLRNVLSAEGYDVLDLGAYNEEPSDYPDFAELVGRAVLEGRAERGLLLCGSGVGASVAANKLRGIRAGLCHDTYSAHQGVEHDNMNVLVLGARVIGGELAKELARAYLNARFDGVARHAARLRKLALLEERR